MNNKLKFNNWFKKKKRLTLEELEAEFAPMTIEQRKAKKGGLINDPFSNAAETSFQPMVNTSFGMSPILTKAGGADFKGGLGYNANVLNSETLPKLTRTKRFGGFPINLNEVVIQGKTKKPEDPFSKLIRLNHPNTAKDLLNSLSNMYRPVPKTDKSDTWKHQNGETSIQLPDVVVKADAPKPKVETKVTSNNLPYLPMPGIGGIGTPEDPRRLPDGVVITAPKSPNYKPQNGSTSLYDAMVNMISAIDLTLSGTEAAAEVMKVNLPKVMSGVGKFTPALGVYDNYRQMTIEGFNWNDTAQMAAGVALIGFSATLGAPVVFVGGLGLFVWELGEGYVNQQK